MNFQKFFVERVVLVSMLTIIFSAIAAAQDNQSKSMMVTEQAKVAMSVATGSNLYCAGFIQSSAISTGNYIIGAKDEADHHIFSQNDFLYINMGRDKGVNVGDTFAVVRPRGAVKSKWANKRDIGFYVQELGALEVVKVKQDVSVVRVKSSCDNFLLGDVVQLIDQRQSPIYEKRPAMDLFSDPSGKATGRILMARDGAEMLTRDYVAYVDLGANENLRVGDHLTVFRPLAAGNLTDQFKRESVSSRDYGFESEKYKGGKFSNQSARKTGDKADGREISTQQVRDSRPPNLRKVVGEAVVLNVKEKTATIVITRTAQEIHTGDWVEIQ